LEHQSSTTEVEEQEAEPEKAVGGQSLIKRSLLLFSFAAFFVSVGDRRRGRRKRTKPCWGEAYHHGSKQKRDERKV
jgi:hypothetical protein